MMKRCVFALALGLILPLTTSSLHAQATATATRGGIAQAGGGIANSNTDMYYNKRITGYTVYGTFDLTPHLGLEADIHELNINTPQDISEHSFEVGARYVYRVRRYEPYAKFMVGTGGYNNNQTYYGNQFADSFFMYSYGGGVDIRLGHRINVRAFDFEFQNWHGYPPHGLTPGVATIGVAYRIR